MKTYTLTDLEVKTLIELFSDTHSVENARALDAFGYSLIKDGYTHHTPLPSSFGINTPVEIVTGYEAIL